RRPFGHTLTTLLATRDRGSATACTDWADVVTSARVSDVYNTKPDGWLLSRYLSSSEFSAAKRAEIAPVSVESIFARPGWRFANACSEPSTVRLEVQQIDMR